MQCASSLLDVQWPALVPVRTKKRYFIPPAVGLKEKTLAEQEARARAAGVVIKQEYMERPINISCTGTLLVLAVLALYRLGIGSIQNLIVSHTTPACFFAFTVKHV